MKPETLFGFHPVFEAIRAGRRELFDLYYTKDKVFNRFERMASADPARHLFLQELKKLRKIHPSQLESMAGTELHQGIGAKVSPYPRAKISEILDSAGDSPFLLLLDNIVDTHNMGALIRTALCAGVNGVIVPKDRSASPTPAVSKASAGALEHLSLVQVTNLVNTIKDLKKKGLWIAGMDRTGETSLFDSDLTGPIAIVIGGEQKGARPLVRKHCDFLMSVPQKGLIDSLNASVAGAVAMYEVFRQRSS
ncbi:23S rRNA (guanosine(2251)-2'-O)-methyltransferase RlmB [Desulfobacterales bacterium HSG2]|nr:23S rRNA (guanosine(2251)-2'-O)-methyltransferase RlmB [Desulfobacterales bacterium HSG2]